MPFTDLEIDADPSDTFEKVENLISGKKYRIVHRIRNVRIEATGIRNMNMYLFLVLILGFLASFAYTVRAWYAPWFLISFSFTLVFCSDAIRSLFRVSP